MASTLSSKNLLELSGDLLPATLKNVNSSPSMAAASGTRKRRRPPAHLSRINLGAPSSRSDLSGSSESLNGGGGAYSSGASNFGSDDDCLTPTPLSHGDEQPPLFSASAAVASLSLNSDEYEKRSRLCPTQLLLDSGSASQSASSSLRSSPIPLPLSSIGISSAANSANLDDCYDLAELECSQSGSAGSTSAKTSGGRLIGEGAYELVGDGRECKAVNVRTQAVYHCQILKLDEYKSFLNVMNRLKIVESFYDGDDFSKMQNVLVPDSVQPICGEDEIWYILSPDHHGNLHTLVQSNYHTNFSTNSTTRIFSERRIQPIFKQIVALVKFCHKIGIYFRDFRLRKFVFTNRERTQIRLNNVLDLWVAADVANDQMTQRHVCPAYVAPEILDVRADAYAGRAADVWALGVLMFILLTNHYPFYDHNPKALFRRIYTRRFSFPVSEHISSNARWLLNGLLRLDPNDRPNADEILHSHWLKADAECLPDGVEDCPPSEIKLTVPPGQTISGGVGNSSSNSALLANSTSQISLASNRPVFSQISVDGASDSTAISASRVIFERSNSHQPHQHSSQMREQQQQRQPSGLRANRSVASFNEIRLGAAAVELSQRGIMPTTAVVSASTAANRSILLAHNRHINNNSQQHLQQQKHQKQQETRQAHRQQQTANSSNNIRLRDGLMAASSATDALAPLQQVSRATSPMSTATSTHTAESPRESPALARPILAVTAERIDRRFTTTNHQQNTIDFDQIVPERVESSKHVQSISKPAGANTVTVAHYHHHQTFQHRHNQQDSPETQAARRQRLSLNVGRAASVAGGMTIVAGGTPSPLTSVGGRVCQLRQSPTTPNLFASQVRQEARSIRVTGGQ